MIGTIKAKLVEGAEAQALIQKMMIDGYAFVVAPGPILDDIFKRIVKEAGDKFTAGDCMGLQVFRDVPIPMQALVFKKNDFSEKAITVYFEGKTEGDLVFRDILLMLCSIESQTLGRWDVCSVSPGQDVLEAIKYATTTLGRVINLRIAEYFAMKSDEALRMAERGLRS